MMAERGLPRGFGPAKSATAPSQDWSSVMTVYLFLAGRGLFPRHQQLEQSLPALLPFELTQAPGADDAIGHKEHQQDKDDAQEKARSCAKPLVKEEL